MKTGVRRFMRAVPEPGAVVDDKADLLALVRASVRTILQCGAMTMPTPFGRAISRTYRGLNARRFPSAPAAAASTPWFEAFRRRDFRAHPALLRAFLGPSSLRTH